MLIILTFIKENEALKEQIDKLRIEMKNLKALLKYMKPFSESSKKKL
jgi:hypothetical protein